MTPVCGTQTLSGRMKAGPLILMSQTTCTLRRGLKPIDYVQKHIQPLKFINKDFMINTQILPGSEMTSG